MKERLFELIAALDLRPVEVATRLGVSKAVVSTWLNGRVEPSSGARSAICATFGVNRAWLDNGDGDMFTKASPTLENATFEELQLAYIRALIERLPEEVQTRVLATVRLYVEEKNRRAVEQSERRNLERLQAEIDEAQAAAQVAEKERAAQTARDDWERRKSTGAFLYQSKVYGNVGSVDNLSVNQAPPPVVESTTAAQERKGNDDAEKTELDATIARLLAIREKKLEEARIEEEKAKKRGK